MPSICSAVLVSIRICCHALNLARPNISWAKPASRSGRDGSFAHITPDGFPRECDRNSRADVRLTIDNQAAPMALHEPRYNTKAEARSLIFAGQSAIRLIERVSGFAYLARCHTNPLVDNRNHDFAIGRGF